MASIDYTWQGVKGHIEFPPEDDLHDDGVFTATGDLSAEQLTTELNGARYLNRGNLRLALDYQAQCSAWEVINALTILGWEYSVSDDLQTSLDAWLAETENSADEDNVN